MTKDTHRRTTKEAPGVAAAALTPSVAEAWQEVRTSFENFCLSAGIETLQAMLAQDAAAFCGVPYERHDGRRGHRWGTTRGPVAFHGGKVDVRRPRVRDPDGKEIVLPTWAAALHDDLLGKWALNLMLINVSTRRFRRAVRLPEGDVPTESGDGTSKSAVSRRFVALSAERMAAWMTADLSQLDLLIIQIDGIQIADEILLVAAVGIDAEGDKHPLAVVDGATENAATVQALLDNLVARGLDPAICRLFVIDGAKALSRAIRKSFGQDTPIQRCQVHKARNILDRLPKGLRASTKRVLRQVWEQGDAALAERRLKALARRLEPDAAGVAGSILEGLDEMLTVIRLGLPDELRRSLCCTNIIENMIGTIRTVSRNVKRWRNSRMALRWTAAGMLEAKKGFRRLKAYKQLPHLKAALMAHQAKRQGLDLELDKKEKAA